MIWLYLIRSYFAGQPVKRLRTAIDSWDTLDAIATFVRQKSGGNTMPGKPGHGDVLSLLSLRQSHRNSSTLQKAKKSHHKSRHARLASLDPVSATLALSLFGPPNLPLLLAKRTHRAMNPPRPLHHPVK